MRGVERTKGSQRSGHPRDLEVCGGGLRHAVGAEGGFLLAEVLVSMLILSIAIMALVPLMMFACRENATARELTVAGTAAQDKAEYLKTLDVDSVTVGEDLIEVGAKSFARKWQIQDDVPLPGMKTVTVSVTPNQASVLGPGRATSVQFYLAK